MRWQHDMEAQQQKTHQELYQLQLSLNNILQSAKHAVDDLHANIQHTDYSSASIHELLKRKVRYGYNNLIRFGWSDREKRLTVGSSDGIYDIPPDISHRAYLQKAHQNPNQMVIGNIITHITIDKEIFTLSRSVVDEHDMYHGTITATINLIPLRNVINKQMINSNRHYRVLSPKGEIIDERGTIDSQHPDLITFKAADNFQLVGHENPENIKRTKLLHITQASSIFIVVTLMVSIGYLLITRLILKPVESTVTALESMLPDAQLSHNLSDKLHQITLLAEHYTAMQTQLQLSEQKLTESQQLIESMNQQQQHMLSASSAQMEQAFEAIARYTEHMEEMIIAQRMDEDQQFYFDDVREMGDNLQLVSSAFYRVCAIKQGNQSLSRAPIDLVELLQHSGHLLHSALERRNQSLKMTTPQAHNIILHADAAMMSELLYCMLYSAIHFAEDEANIHIALTHGNNGWQITYDISHYRRSLLSPEKQDFSAFMPSAARNISQPLREHILQHMNIWIARSFLALHESDLDVSIHDNERIFLSLDITDLEPQCPAKREELAIIH